MPLLPSILALDSCFLGLMQISWSVILFRAFRLRLYLDIAVICICHVAISASVRLQFLFSLKRLILIEMIVY